MRRISVLSLVSAVLMAIPSSAAAQGLPSDPEADSPSGVVYEIPAERGRKDAAPRNRTRDSQGESGGSQSGGSSSRGGTSGGSSSGSGAVEGASETSIRSENNFGTSSNVPGAGESKKGRKADDRSRAAGSAGGSGDESGDGGSSVSDVAADAARSTAASTEGPSDEVVFPLIAVLVAAGILIGIVASRRAFRGRG